MNKGNYFGRLTKVYLEIYRGAEAGQMVSSKVDHITLLVCV